MPDAIRPDDDMDLLAGADLAADDRTMWWDESASEMKAMIPEELKDGLGVATATLNTLINDAIDVHAALTTDAHGAVTATSNICEIHSPAGTAKNIYVDEESSPSVGENLGDLQALVYDGFFTP